MCEAQLTDWVIGAGLHVENIVKQFYATVDVPNGFTKDCISSTVLVSYDTEQMYSNCVL